MDFFDFNKDGILSLDEEFIRFMAFEECTGDDEDDEDEDL